MYRITIHVYKVLKVNCAHDTGRLEKTKTMEFILYFLSSCGKLINIKHLSDIFPLMSGTDIVSINESALILKNYRKIIGQCDVKHNMMLQITITSILKVLDIHYH